MPRYLLLATLSLTLVYVAAFAADKSPGGDKVKLGGLVCFSVDAQHGENCDALCAKAEMACTGVAATENPPLRCSDAIDDTIAPFPVCRCCALDHHL